MQYLPYLEEKSRDDQILTPIQQISMNPRIEGLPLYSSAYNMMIWNTKETEDLPAFARYFYWIPGAFWGMLVDGFWQIWNTALNGYKRLYNNAATLYNNAAAGYNNWRTTRSTPQTRLTWRKITYDMNPAYYNQTIDFAEKPKQYLVGTDWNIVAQIGNPYPYVSRVVQAQQLTPAYGTQGALMQGY